MSNPLIELASITKTFERDGRHVPALAPLSLDVHEREFVALVGPSGCGKSTVLNMVAGLFQPTDGRVVYRGNAVSDLNRRVGYMTQKCTLLPWRSAAANISAPLELSCRSIDQTQRVDRVRQMIELVGLKGFENHFPGELSGGMRKRVSLARMLVYDPDTLLMDEPFGALDAQLKLIMQDELQRIVGAGRKTVMFVTHDLGEAIALADRVVVFSSRPGRIKTIRKIDLPRPRDVYRIRFTPEFSEIHEELWDQLKDEVGKGTDA
jgi:NitT/TauT family transport system ATP-binding protein